MKLHLAVRHGLAVVCLLVAALLGACASPGAGPDGSVTPLFSVPPEFRVDTGSGDGLPGDFATSAPGPDIGAGPGPGGAGNVVVFEPWFVTDPMADNATALTFLAPAGWQASGSVVWLPEWRRMAHLQTRVSDPQTGLTVEWLPGQDFIWFEPLAGLPPPPIGGNYQGKAYVPPANDPAQFVADFWMPGMLSHLRSAALVRVDQVPPIAEEFVRQYGGPATAAAFRMRYEFNGSDGQVWEEDVFFAWLFPTTDLPLLWYVNFAYTVRAPKGVIDANIGTVSTIIASRATTPQWESVYRLAQSLMTQRIQQQMADTRALGELMAEHRAEREALQQQVTAERQASQDRIAELRGEVLAGVETFVDPISQQLVQLPSGAGTYWVNDQGQYLSSNQPGFDPATAFGGTWTTLQPRQ